MQPAGKKIKRDSVSESGEEHGSPAAGGRADSLCSWGTLARKRRQALRGACGKAGPVAGGRKRFAEHKHCWTGLGRRWGSCWALQLSSFACIKIHEEGRGSTEKSVLVVQTPGERASGLIKHSHRRTLQILLDPLTDENWGQARMWTQKQC